MGPDPGAQGVSKIRDVIVSEHAVEPELAERDLLALLQDLADEGLIEVCAAGKPS